MAKKTRQPKTDGKNATMVLRNCPAAVPGDSEESPAGNQPAVSAGSAEAVDQHDVKRVSGQVLPGRAGKRGGPYTAETRDLVRGAVIALSKKLHTQEEISRELGVSPKTIRSWMKKTVEDFPSLPAAVDSYPSERMDIVQTVERKALKSVHDKLDDPSATLRDATIAFKTLHMAGRLERNLSTENSDQKISFTDHSTGNTTSNTDE